MKRLVLALTLAAACTHKDPPPPPTGTARCEVDLTATGLFSQDGSGSSASVIHDPSQLIGGEGATGRLGDVLLQNDKIRVIVEQPGRSIGPFLSGGHIIDADLQRPAGEPGRDGWGRINLMYAMGRVTSVDKVEVLRDGSSGGPAVVASTGHDSENDVLNVKMLLMNQAGLDVDFIVDAKKPVPVRTTTYYVLSPGESRVRTLTAFCNDGTTAQPMPLIELMDVGTDELFFPGACLNGLGAQPLDFSSGCVVSTPSWFATMNRGVSYGVRPYQLADPTKPVEKNAIIAYGGVVADFVDGESLQGLISWSDATARSRPGTFLVRPGGQKTYLHDFVVGRDMAAVSSTFLKAEGVATGHVDVTAPAGSRVTVLSSAVMQTLIETDAEGKGAVDLPPGDYTLSAATEGRLIGPELTAHVTAGSTQSLALTLAPTRTLHVTVTDPSGAPSPAKVTVACASAPCAFNRDTWKQHLLVDGPAWGAAAIGYVPVGGQLDLHVPPGQYQVVVSRGPEYSVWPDTFPASGQSVDLTAQDQSLAAVVGRIVDTTGWVSSDLHVHAVASSDSSTQNARRVANFIAEGVDVLLSTDHETVTDFAPVITELNADGFIKSMIGEEVTTFSHGHFNTFPRTRDSSVPNGGAFDHAGGEDGATLRMPQLFDGVHAQFPGSVVQLNHPRGQSGGVLTLLQIDTATLHSHGDPATFNMAAAPDATADDTRLFGPGFDLIETMNGPDVHYGLLNDWMTFLSRGTVRTATGVSDTHGSYGSSGGYARTYAQLGSFTPAGFADALRARRAFVSNGPFIKVTANGKGIGDTVSVAAGGEVTLTVDLQGPDWMQLDRVELYSYAAGREALNGQTNDTWPDARILDKHELTSLTVEPVPGSSTLRRAHQVEQFVAHPTADTWYVVMVRGLSGRTMWPLHGERPIAFSNAILVDADGSGAYDAFPLGAGQPLSAPPAAHVWKPVVPTPAQLERAIWDLVYADHHR